MVMTTGQQAQIFAPPYHPYTEALLAAMPMADARVAKREIVLEGPLPSALDPPAGCRFHTRCPQVMERCRREEPPLAPESGRLVACHLYPAPGP